MKSLRFVYKMNQNCMNGDHQLDQLTCMHAGTLFKAENGKQNMLYLKHFAISKIKLNYDALCMLFLYHNFMKMLSIEMDQCM